MSSSSYEDRRAHPRYPLVLQVSYPGERELKDCTENLSEGGLFIRTDRDLKVGQRLPLQLSFSPLLKAIEVEVEVVRRREASEHQAAGVAVRVPEDRIEDRRRLRELSEAARAATIAPRKCRLLVVDDNQLVARIFADALNSAISRFSTVTVEICTNGRDALVRLRNLPRIDLVIADNFMPGMSGLELLAAIRSDELLKNLPVVMVSSNPVPEAPQEAFRLGASAYLRKPVNPVDIISTVQALLHLGSSK